MRALATAQPEFWRGRRVLLTGHTGFKGAWLSLWLQRLGADLTGFSRGTPTEPSLFVLGRVAEGMRNIDGDVRDYEALAGALAAARPEVVIHMAAQPLVRRSFAQPRLTYEINVMGTVNLLDAVRCQDGVRVVINVTTDKCYENREQDAGYREDDRLGGHDPYASSKACSELVTIGFRRSFFAGPEAPRLAAVRAGNVIGGGDWGEDRLIPDIMRGALKGAPIPIRNPDAVRPWQHVLNPLSGYLRLAEALASGPELVGGWNFGPVIADARPVRWITDRLAALWPEDLDWAMDLGPHPHETQVLALDSGKARTQLQWVPSWGLDEALVRIVAWYRALREGEDMRAVTLGQITAFEACAGLV